MPVAVATQRARELDRRRKRFEERGLVNLSGEFVAVNGSFTSSFGGVWDTASMTWAGPRELSEVTYEIGEQQAPPIDFLRRRQGPSRFVLVGAAGSGKTEILSACAAAHGTEYRNAQIGMVSSTSFKLGTLWKKFLKRIPQSWIRDVREKPLMGPPYIALVNGVDYLFFTAKAASKQLGTQLHSFDLVAAFLDEEEQMPDEAIYDTFARGRSAPDGWYPVMSTCTISDDPEFRARYARYKAEAAEGKTVLLHLAITSNPWVEQSFIDDMRQKLPPREFAQRFLAREEPPERATYNYFDRTRHIRPLFDIGAVDCTRRRTGADYLIGHDPGELRDVSIVLKCFEMRSEIDGVRKVEDIWFVVGELTTERTTSEEHAHQLAHYLQDRFGAHMLEHDKDGELELDMSSPQVTIRADPKGGSSKGVTSKATYRYFQRLKFDIRPAQYKRTANPKLAADHGTLLVDDRIECINTLLYSAAKRTRLYIQADSMGHPVAPKLAMALEMSQRDDYGRPEMQRKDTHDLSHWPSALGYALWPYEKPHRMEG